MRILTDPRFRHPLPWAAVLVVVAGLFLPALTRPRLALGEQKPDDPPKTSYDQISPVLQGLQSFDAMRQKDKAAKDGVMARHGALS